jgi:hypothetical protein
MNPSRSLDNVHFRLSCFWCPRAVASSVYCSVGRCSSLANLDAVGGQSGIVGDDRGSGSIEEVYRLKLLAYRGFVLLLAGLLAASAIWISLAAADADWASKEIDPAMITCCPSVTEAPGGVLKIAFGTNEGLVCAVETSTGWSVSPVMMLEDYAGMAAVYEVAIACDEDGWSHIASVSYWEDGEDSSKLLVHSKETSSGWQNTIVDDSLMYNPISISVDSNSRAHIAYSKWWWDGRVRANISYATDESGSWVCNENVLAEYPDFHGDWGLPSIAVDSQNRPHIAFLLDYSLGYVTSPSGDPEIDILALGNPSAAASIYPSAPSVLIDSADTVHILYFDEYKESADSPITRTVNHCSITAGAKLYENSTRSSDYDHSYSLTKACVDDSGRFWIFHGSGYEIGVITLSGDGRLDEQILIDYRDVDGLLHYGSSAVIRASGEVVISKPYGAMGYITDSVSLSYRLSAGMDSLDANGKIVLAAAIVILVVAAVYSRRALREEMRWRAASSEKSGTDDA